MASSLFFYCDHHDGMKQIQIKYQTRLGCHHSLTKLSECNRIQLVWVPRHTGSDGNDIVDRLARQKSLHPPTGHEPAFGLSSGVAGGVIRDGTSRKHEDHQQSTRGQRQAKGFPGRLPLKELENYWMWAETTWDIDGAAGGALLFKWTGAGRLSHLW
jgi:hypothetical protein